MVFGCYIFFKAKQKLTYYLVWCIGETLVLECWQSIMLFGDEFDVNFTGRRVLPLLKRILTSEVGTHKLEWLTRISKKSELVYKKSAGTRSSMLRRKANLNFVSNETDGCGHAPKKLPA